MSYTLFRFSFVNVIVSRERRRDPRTSSERVALDLLTNCFCDSTLLCLDNGKRRDKFLEMGQFSVDMIGFNEIDFLNYKLEVWVWKGINIKILILIFVLTLILNLKLN